jgi:hypothetical protein
MDDEIRKLIKDRLAQPVSGNSSRKTAANCVRYLYANIEAAVAAGKTWRQIAEDCSADRQYSSDALRQAYAIETKSRVKRSEKQALRRRRVATPAAPQAAPPIGEFAGSPEFAAFSSGGDTLADIKGSKN